MNRTSIDLTENTYSSRTFVVDETCCHFHLLSIHLIWTTTFQNLGSWYSLAVQILPTWPVLFRYDYIKYLLIAAGWGYTISSHTFENEGVVGVIVVNESHCWQLVGGG